MLSGSPSLFSDIWEKENVKHEDHQWYRIYGGMYDTEFTRISLIIKVWRIAKEGKIKTASLRNIWTTFALIGV